MGFREYDLIFDFLEIYFCLKIRLIPNSRPSTRATDHVNKYRIEKSERVASGDKNFLGKWI